MIENEGNGKKWNENKIKRRNKLEKKRKEKC